MAVIISKTFTTAETMLNARTVRTWLTAQLGKGGSWLQGGGGGGGGGGGEQSNGMGEAGCNSCCCIRRDAGKYRRGWAYMHLGVPLCMVA
jgi:hypothetical protein